jgi:hypothetical protein
MPGALVFTESQIENFKDDDVILVTNHLKVIDSFLWKDRDIIGYKIEVTPATWRAYSNNKIWDVITCDNCEHQWKYFGERTDTISCPMCRANVKLEQQEKKEEK